MAKMVIIALCSIFICCFNIGSFAADSPISKNIISLSGEACPHGLHQQPNGPFAIIVFCEDALGSSLAVVCYESGKCDRLLDVKNGAIIGWEVADRVWQSEPWAADVTSIAWSPSGKYLYVASADPYGAGGLFQLDLYRRTYTQILPKNLKVTIENPGSGYVITGMDQGGKTLRAETRESENSDAMRTETVTLSP